MRLGTIRRWSRARLCDGGAIGGSRNFRLAWGVDGLEFDCLDRSLCCSLPTAFLCSARRTHHTLAKSIATLLDCNQSDDMPSQASASPAVILFDRCSFATTRLPTSEPRHRTQ